jgi:hypothetical protein
VTVTARLTAAGRRALERRRRIAVQVVVIVEDGDGSARVWRARATLRR